jgi:hypothetical protein
VTAYPTDRSVRTKRSVSRQRFSLRYRCTQDLCPEESTLCSLDDLLVDGLWRVVHNDCAGLVIDLCVYARIADEVDDPLLAFVL